MKIKYEIEVERKEVSQLDNYTAYLVMEENNFESIIIKTLSEVIRITNHSNEENLWIGLSSKKSFNIIGRIYDFDISNVKFN